MISTILRKGTDKYLVGCPKTGNDRVAGCVGLDVGGIVSKGALRRSLENWASIPFHRDMIHRESHEGTFPHHALLL